jgi:spore maturation protein CgeB
VRVTCVLPRYNYGDPGRGETHEASSFVPALRQLGHDVEFFDSWSPDHANFVALNRSLLRHVEQFQPELIIAAQMHYEIWAETWQIIRSAGIATAHWCTDDSWKYAQFSRLVAPLFDAIATTCAGREADYRRDGHDHVLLTQWAANGSALAPPLPARECAIPVSFVGSAYGARRAWIGALREHGVDVQCFGFGWGDRPVAAADIPRIMRDSVISLNFAGGSARFGDRIARANQLKARAFEVAGAGGFLLTESTPGIERYYSLEREIATFTTAADAAAQIGHFLANPEVRDRMALAAFERTQREHTYEQRMRELIAFTLARRESSARTREFRGIDWDRFELAVSRSHGSAGLRAAAAVLTSTAALVLGPRRGQRLVRRAVFELSWRFAGARTYSAAGLPGRMFHALW